MMMCARLQRYTHDYQRSRSRDIETPQRRALARLFNVPIKQVVKTGESLDKSGVDWIVFDAQGQVIATVDGQHRFYGAAPYWTATDADGNTLPDIALELSMNIGTAKEGKFTGAVPPKADYLLQAFSEHPVAYLVCASAAWHAVNVSGRLSHIAPRTNRTVLPWGQHVTGSWLPVDVSTLSTVTGRMWAIGPDAE